MHLAQAVATCRVRLATRVTQPTHARSPTADALSRRAGPSTPTADPRPTLNPPTHSIVARPLEASRRETRCVGRLRLRTVDLNPVFADVPLVRAMRVWVLIDLDFTCLLNQLQSLAHPLEFEYIRGLAFGRRTWPCTHDKYVPTTLVVTNVAQTNGTRGWCRSPQRAHCNCKFEVNNLVDRMPLHCDRVHAV